jgi:hypothetical protein
MSKRKEVITVSEVAKKLFSMILSMIMETFQSLNQSQFDYIIM